MVQEKNIVRLGLTIIMFIALLGLVSTSALANGHNQYGKRACSKTASSAYLACQYEVKDDYWIAKGNCYNLSDEDAQDECFDEAKDEYKGAKEECKDQLEARKEVCEGVGEAPYDPINDLEPTFIDPDTINASNANPYFPLVVGNTWVYEGGGETITVTVTGETVTILGVKCREVSDVVEEDGVVIEETKDWYAQDEDGNVWYMGERSLSREACDEEEDDCDTYLLADDGSWIAGVDSALPGIIMFGDLSDKVGTVFRQEFALGDAEDVAEVESVTATESVPGGSCTDDCLKTRDFTPIEPGVDEFKYYAPGIGLILEVDPEGERVELQTFTPGP
ncbi:MAG: hypothetical protein WBF55_01665 [Syntrophobacteria bacterium]